MGLFTVMLRERGVKDIVLLEKSKACIKIIADTLRINGLKDVLLLEGDINESPFVGRCFDTIVCLEVLEHLVFPRKALKEMARVCRKGGDLYLTVPLNGLMPPSKVRGHHQDFDHADLHALIESTGWTVYKHFEDDTYQYFYSRRKR